MQNLTLQDKKIAVVRLTAFWALCECGLGGFLHLFKIPFTGLIIGGLAIICIACIFLFSHNKKQVFQSLLVVLCIKLSISPFIPPTAYLSVCFQAGLSYIVYYFLRVNVASFFIVALLSMLQSAIQKLIVLTLFFGNELWYAVDVFCKYVVSQLGFSTYFGSQTLIAIYLSIYIVGAIFISFVFGKIIYHLNSPKLRIIILDEVWEQQKEKRKNSHKQFIKLFLILFFTVIVLSLFNKSSLTIVNGIYLIARTVLIVFIWFYILTPLFGLILKKGTTSLSVSFNNKIIEAIQVFPETKQLLQQVWNSTSSIKFIKRIYIFLIEFFVALITYQAKVKT
jgi:hypothetical protein